MKVWKNAEKGVHFELSSTVNSVFSIAQTRKDENNLARMRTWALETPGGFLCSLKLLVNSEFLH